MRRLVLLFLLAAAGLPAAASAGLPDTTEGIASYLLRAEYDPKTHVIRGSGEILWKNTTDEPVGDLWFHLYLNAFRNDESAHLRESGPGEGPRGDGEWGACDIRRLFTDTGYDLMPSFRYEREEGAPPGDRTVASVRLPALVLPGSYARVRIEWESRMPRLWRRSGYARDFVFAGQWFPKLAVFEKQGARGVPASGWNAHAYHARTEFYSDFGDYDVTLVLPDGWEVGGTGLEEGDPIEVLQAPPPSGSKGHRFRARSVHDFAWVASPRLHRVSTRFLPEEWRNTATEEALRGIGVSEDDIALREVRMDLLIPPDLAAQAPRFFRAAGEALAAWGYLLGRYPYPALTIVVPPRGAEGCGGMEYPTLVTTGTDWFSPREQLVPEFVTVHEVGHQFFYGLIASNEFEEPWLDEGFNVWMTSRVLSRAYGGDVHVSRVAGLPLRRKPLLELPGNPGSWGGPLVDELRLLLLLRQLGVPSSPVLDYLRDQPFLSWERGVRVDPLLQRRARLLDAPDLDPIGRFGFRTYDHAAYRSNAYDKPALLLATLERVFGEAAMLRTMRTWGERQRFRHPGAEDFRKTAEEAVGRDLGWLFDPFLRGTATVDYAVGAVENRPAKRPAGLYEEGGSLVTRSAAESDREWEAQEERDRRWEATVSVLRRGTASLPVEVRVVFADGREETRTWDGADRWVRWTFPKRVVRVEVDPSRRLLLDLDWRNNAWSEAPDRRPALRLYERALRWAESVLVFYRKLG